MKVTCNRGELLEGLQNTARAAAVKSTMPVIEGILFRAEGSGVYLCGYNLEMGISKSIPAACEEDGSVVLPARVCDMIRRMPEERVEISCDERFVVNINSGETAFSIVGMRPDDFPELPGVDGEKSASVPEGLLKSMIAQTFYAISASDINPVYKGALFEIDDGNFSIITLDGYRLAVRNENISGEGGMRFIVPGKTLQEVRQLLGESDDAVEICAAPSNIILTVGGYNIISRLFTGDFVDYRAVFSREYAYEVRVKTADVAAAVDRVSLVNSESHRAPIKCVFGGGQIRMTCETAVGKADDKIPCECDFEDAVEIGFNSKYMQDAFKNVDCDEIILRILQPDKPVQVLPPEGEHFFFLLLPVRLS